MKSVFFSVTCTFYSAVYILFYYSLTVCKPLWGGVSEDKFQKIFDSCPVAFSITTLEEGRFLEVNAAFEARYGYSRQEVLGHTVTELKVWDDPADRRLLVTQLQRGGPIRNVMTRLRAKSGEIKLTAYSADRIEFDGQRCILAVSEDVVTHDPRVSN